MPDMGSVPLCQFHLVNTTQFHLVNSAQFHLVNSTSNLSILNLSIPVLFFFLPQVGTPNT